MITVMVHATVKQELLEDYLNLIKRLHKETTKKGCITYSFNQNREEPSISPGALPERFGM